MSAREVIFVDLQYWIRWVWFNKKWGKCKHSFDFDVETDILGVFRSSEDFLRTNSLESFFVCCNWAATRTKWFCRTRRTKTQIAWLPAGWQKAKWWKSAYVQRVNTYQHCKGLITRGVEKGRGYRRRIFDDFFFENSVQLNVVSISNRECMIKNSRAYISRSHNSRAQTSKKSKDRPEFKIMIKTNKKSSQGNCQLERKT